MKDYPEKLTDGYYHVRTSWEDEQSQVGQYKLLKSAVAKCDSTPGTHIFTEDGTEIYPEKETQDGPVEEIEEETVINDDDGSFNKEETAFPSVDYSNIPNDRNTPNDENTTPVFYGRVTTLLNVRAGTSLDEKKVGLLKKGRLIEILEDCGEGWYRISFDVPCGYAFVNNATGTYIRTGSSLYTVAPTDTIRGIAEEMLGDENRFSEIIELNGLTSNAIRAGMMLLIP